MTRAIPAADERAHGLLRIRRVTVTATLAATALAGATAGVAAMTLPGRSTGTAGSSGSGAAQQPQQAQQQDGLKVPDQPPQVPADQGPLVITGSS